MAVSRRISHGYCCREAVTMNSSAVMTADVCKSVTSSDNPLVNPHACIHLTYAHHVPEVAVVR